MYSNVGGKIKIFAQVVAWVGIIGSAIGGIYSIGTGFEMLDSPFTRSIGTGMVILGLFLPISGSLSSYVLSLFLYGFGELIENMSETARNTANTTASLENEATEILESGEWICRTCRAKNYPGESTCYACKAKRDEINAKIAEDVSHIS